MTVIYGVAPVARAFEIVRVSPENDQDSERRSVTSPLFQGALLLPDGPLRSQFD